MQNASSCWSLGSVQCRQIPMASSSSSSSSTLPPRPTQNWIGDCSPSLSNGLLNASPRLLELLTPTSNGWKLSKEPASTSNAEINSDVQTPPKQSSARLIEEITELEAEIVHLEWYVLSLYRTVFQRHLRMADGKNVKELDAMPHLASSGPPYPKSKVKTPRDIDSPQGQSSPSLHFSCPKSFVPVSLSMLSPSMEKRIAMHPNHSLDEHLGKAQINNSLVSPDKLSEDIIKCISSFYCKMANPLLSYKVYSASSTSSFCSSSTFSPRNLSCHWSPQYSEKFTENCELGNRQSAEAVEILKICLDDENCSYATTMLRTFRSLVKSLETVDPMKMTREQKLAFWINIHNALLMHAYLVNGTQNHIKNDCIVKAAYNVGGHCINADDIQSSILGIRPHYSVPWLQTFVSPGRMFKIGNAKHPYALEYPEPLVHFGLCSGTFWDPMVRSYSAKTVFDDLEAAKADFIKSTIYVHKETKIYLPKILCYYAKDALLGVPAMLEIISEYVPDPHREAIRARVKDGRLSKHINWLEQTSSFRYLIHKKLAQP